MSWEYNYLALCNEVMQYGLRENSRAGPTRALLGRTLKVMVPPGRFPLTTTRKAFYKPVLGELAAFLEGAEFNYDFVKHGCNYWTPNARAWMERNHGKEYTDKLADEDLEVGRIYGYQWRRWGGNPGFDQLAEAQRMIVNEPTSRRILVNCWNPADIDLMCLPPCHTHFQYHVRHGRLSCSIYMRSVDLCLGLPADVTLYFALLCIMAQDCGLQPGELHYHFGNAHVYEAHIPGLMDQLKRVPYVEPKYTLGTLPDEKLLNNFKPAMFDIDYAQKHDAISYELFA